MGQYLYEIIGGLLIVLSSAVTEALPSRLKKISWLGFLVLAIIYSGIGVHLQRESSRQAAADRTSLTSELESLKGELRKREKVEPPRSFIVFDGSIRFPVRKDSTGQIVPEQHLQVGDSFFFDIPYKATGPNPVRFVDYAEALYLKSDSTSTTQNQLIENFQTGLTKVRKKIVPGQPSTLLPGDQRYFSDYALDEHYKPRAVTADDLVGLQTGTEIVFVIAEIRYTDQGKMHHSRECFWLQRPPNPPGIWHSCEGFGNSD